jgi:hypothetical protein
LLFDRERTMRLGERDLEPILHGMAWHGIQLQAGASTAPQLEAVQGVRSDRSG